ncbi:Fe-S cluster assembly ATPase SufC [Catenisphaera adipataccumulans]|jgi:Fe-S cluster assembly ATP-binding protein|uniref:Fe-S cluster assembly ATP-binding protein n=1 Tax=Catenisphaera adipataccumulans TaxID=700500 RepID=A0A7W8D006_9FIRM|nr:Fe-S cluster assembly ATPase SufC [Catenisphaera adipataccumulans]MBB5183588.1 Fe-S cluster assembly ATP-binding protein [Catenisphaera adipataccumulans]
MTELVIQDLHVSVEEKEILKGLDLTVRSGETHALMGPNGNGKSTLLAAVMGNPKFTVTQGTITLDGKNVLEMPVDERSKAGLFLGMQYPSEISGVTNSDFLRSAINARREQPIGLFKFIKEMDKAIEQLEMKPDLAHRFLNDGFSGGEKKRNEIVQMMMLKPSIAMLDEIDSGLDVDALRIVSNAIKQCQSEMNTGLLIVSHYARFYEYLQPTHAHILIDGQIVVSGDQELVEKVDHDGYEWIEKEYHVKAAKEETKQPISLGSCAVKQGA